MAKAFALMLGILLVSHGILGIFIEGSHLFGVLNVDFFIDIVYLGLASMLLFVGVVRVPPMILRGVLALTGCVFIAIGGLSILDDQLWGLLPRGVTLVDLTLFFGAGVPSLLLAAAPRIDAPLETQGKAIN